MSQGPDLYQGNSFLSVSRKKEALWNVVQPGDPYDIRKSMIAKVPFDKKTFMGDHLQLVCLFQAAQIQRLCEFLQDFKLKYRQVQRRELDRHSYEVQIKQLTHKLAEQSVYREENQKLRQFLKNQSINKQGVEDSIKSKYEKLLLQAKNFEDQNYQLRHENENLNYQMSSFDAKFQALKKSKQTEIDDIYMKMSQNSDVASHLELSSLRSQYESQLQRLDLQNKRLKHTNQQKIRQIESWNEKCRVLQQQLLRNSPKGDASKFEKKIFEYENRFVIFGQQIDRLNLVIKQISQKYEIAEQRVREYESKYDAANKELLMLQSKQSSYEQPNSDILRKISELEDQNHRLRQSGKFLPEFQVRLRQANQQIIRLSAQLKIMLENQNIFKSQIQKYQYQANRARVLQKELSDYKQAVQNNELKLKIAQDQNQVAILKQQIQRLHEELLKKNNLQNNLRNLTLENQSLQTKISDSERRYQITVQDYEMRIQQKVSEYESRIQNINRSKGYEFESKASSLQNEVQRLSDQLRRKTDDVENYQKQIRELQFTITNKYEVDASRRVQNYESALQNLKRQNEELVRRIRQLEPLQRKISEHQNRFTITAQQIERLSQIIRNKDIEIDNLKKQIREQQASIIQRYQLDTSRKINNYETNLNNLNRQNQQFRRKCTQMENKIALLSQQIERLTNNLREFQQKSIHGDQEIQRLQNYIRQSEVNITQKYQFDINQKVNNYENVLKNFQRQNEELRKRIFELENTARRLPQYENQLKLAGQQIERLNVGLRSKQQQIVHFQNNNRNLIKQFQQLGRKYNDLQSQVKNKFQVEANRVISTLQQNITNFKRENDELKRLLQNSQQNNIRLNQQNEEMRRRFQQDFGEVSKRINEYESFISQLKHQNQILRRKVQELEIIIKQKYQIEANQKISYLEQNHANSSRQNEDLRKRLDLTSRQLDQFRRIVQKLQRDNEELGRRLRQYGDINKKVVEYENKISFLAQQSERVNLTLKSKMQDLIKADAYIKELTLKIQNSERSMNQSQSSIQQFEIQVKNRITHYQQNINILSQENNELKRKIPQYQNKIVILNQQLQRINQNFKSHFQRSNQLESALKNSSIQNQNLRRNIVDLQNSFTQKYQVQATRVIRTQQQNIEGLQRQNTQLKKVLAQYQQNLNSQNVDLQKYNLSLKNLSEQNNALKNQIRQTEIGLVQKYQSQFSTRQTVYETQKTQFKRQNQELVKRLREFGERVAPEYQNQIAILKQQIQRLSQFSKNENNQLTSNLKSLAQENQALKKQIFELQQTYTQKFQVEVQRKYSAYEQNISVLQSQNQQMKNYIQQLGGKFQGEMKSYGQNFALLQRQNEELKRNLQQISLRFESQTKKGGNLEQNLTGFARQNEELKRKLTERQQQMQQIIRKINELQYENEEIKRQAREGSLQIVQKLQSESTQQITVYKQQILQFENQLNVVQRQNEDLKRRLTEFGGESNRVIGKYEQDLRRLTGQVEKLNGRIREYETKIRQFGGENESLRRQAKESQINISQKWQFEFKNKSQAYEQAILALKRQNQELQINLRNATRSIQDKQKNLIESSNKRIVELQNKVALMSQQIERLIQNLRLRQQQNQKMHEQIERISHSFRLKLQESKQMENQITKLRSATQSQFSQLQSNYTVMTRENQNYKKHLLQYENSIKKLYAQFERLQNIINDLKREREDLFEKNYALSTEIDRLLNQNKDLQTQVEDVRLRLTDESSLNKRINQHMGLMVILFAQIESLRRRVKEKEKQVDDVRRSSLAPFKLDRSRPKMQSI